MKTKIEESRERSTLLLTTSHCVACTADYQSTLSHDTVNNFNW